MIQFTSVEVLKTKENFHYVAWDVIPTEGEIPLDSPSNYEFMVYWSNDPDSDFHSIKDDNGDDVIIDGDTTSQLEITHLRKHYNFNNKYYYSVVGYKKTDPLIGVKSDTVYFGMFSDGVHTQIKHAEETLYDMYYGEPTVLVKRKPYGEPCGECWSPERQQRTKSNCDTCNGTGKIVGYYEPITIQMGYDSDPVASTVGHSYETVQDTKRARASNYPILRPRDLIINTDDNKRYVATHIETTKLPVRAVSDSDPRRSFNNNKLSKQNYVVSQLLTLQELCADDQEYFLDYERILPDPDNDYSLPRFQTHEPATGVGPIDVDGNQVVSLNYSDDFELDPLTGELVLTNPLDYTGILKVSFLLDEGINTLKNIPFISQNTIPGSDVVTKLSKITINAEKSTNINPNSATVRIAEYDTSATTEYDPNTIAYDVFDSTFGDGQNGLKFYEAYTILVDELDPCQPMTPGKGLFVNIEPGDGWAFENIRVTLELELVVA